MAIGEVLYQGEVAYERAVFIGNLLYRLTTPYAVVLPRNVSEIQQIVKYCFTNKVRLTVKNGGGHSYAGYCLNDEGIVLDMSAMKEVQINDQGTIVSIQGEATWVDAYATLVGNNAANILIGGQCPSVGVSGFTLGGGLSPFSRSYGLGVDNVIQMRMVTATGDLVTVSSHDTDPKKQDLFWALRGGGGGNYGVLVDFTSTMHKLNNPTGLTTAEELTWTFPDEEQHFKDMMKYWNTHTWQNALTIDIIVRWVDGKMLGQMTVIYNGRYDECMKVVAPLLKFGKVDNGLKEMPWSGWVKSEEGFEDDSKVYHHHASVIVAEGGINEKVTELIVSFVTGKESHTFAHDPGMCSILWDHIGGKTEDVSPTSTAFYWRKGVAL
ncbi:FAD-binding domain-containing protein [Agrocybe pediades]|nr:FAD-binding domain-containing protein [Agrocybe pediades]